MEYVMSHQEVVNIGDTVGTSCIVCGEPVLFSYNEFERFKKGLHVDSKVCNQCKAAGQLLTRLKPRSLHKTSSS